MDNGVNVIVVVGRGVRVTVMPDVAVIEVFAEGTAVNVLLEIIGEIGDAVG